MVQDFRFIALRSFGLRRFLCTILDLEAAHCTSSALQLLVEGYSPPRREHQALNDCWCVLQALAIGLSRELVDQSATP